MIYWEAFIQMKTRTIKYTAKFKRDYHREKKSGRHRDRLDETLLFIVKFLVTDRLLASRYHDHPLAGEWKDNRNCHIRLDLILIYRKPDDETLELVRLGSHSQLSL